MNAQVLLIAALVAVAAARPQDYHDDVFHFSTKVHPENLVHSSVVSQSVPVFAKALPVQSVVVKSVPQYQAQYQPQYQQQSVFVKSAPVYSQVQHHVVQQQPSVLFRSVEQEIPTVSTVHTHHVHQPVYSQLSSISQVAAVAPAAAVVSRSSFVPQYHASSIAEPKIKILKQIQEFDPTGIYRANYETENGIVASEQGSVKDIQAKDGPVAAKEGSYSYTGPDGVQYTVNWIADEFGFRASGAHLPVAPEVPAEIQRSLQLIASQPQKYNEEGNLVYKQF